jgi:hypothetical protein
VRWLDWQMQHHDSIDDPRMKILQTQRDWHWKRSLEPPWHCQAYLLQVGDLMLDQEESLKA